MRFRPFFAVLSCLSLLPFAPTASAESQTGAVYVASNEATGNRILQFHRDDSGALTPVGSFNTGGLGTGGGLGNQGGLVLPRYTSPLDAVLHQKLHEYRTGPSFRKSVNKVVRRPTASVTIWCVPHLLVIANTSSCISANSR